MFNSRRCQPGVAGVIGWGKPGIIVNIWLIFLPGTALILVAGTRLEKCRKDLDRPGIKQRLGGGFPLINLYFLFWAIFSLLTDCCLPIFLPKILSLHNGGPFNGCGLIKYCLSFAEGFPLCGFVFILSSAILLPISSFLITNIL